MEAFLSWRPGIARLGICPLPAEIHAPQMSEGLVNIRRGLLALVDTSDRGQVLPQNGPLPAHPTFEPLSGVSDPLVDMLFAGARRRTEHALG